MGLIAGGVAGPVSEKMGEMLKIATSNCERLVCLVNDILDLEKIETGGMTYNMTNLLLATSLAEMVELNRSYAARFNVSLELHNEMPCTVGLYVDKDRLSQVLTNLIANAAKFSPPNAIVRIETGESDAEGKLRICVRDQGTGILEGMRERIFEKFVQVESTKTRVKGGSGLGLSISKAIVEAFGGNIGVDCPATGGSLFYIELPAQCA